MKRNGKYFHFSPSRTKTHKFNLINSIKFFRFEAKCETLTFSPLKCHPVPKQTYQVCTTLQCMWDGIVGSSISQLVLKIRMCTGSTEVLVLQKVPAYRGEPTAPISTCLPHNPSKVTYKMQRFRFVFLN